MSDKAPKKKKATAPQARPATDEHGRRIMHPEHMARRGKAGPPDSTEED